MHYNGKGFLHTVALHLDLLNTIGGGVSETYVQLDKKENGTTIKVWAAGVTPETFKIILNQNQLSISSTVTNADNPGVSVPMFNKTFILPSVVNQAGIEAIYKNGKLLIHLPYYESASKPREITIKEL